jgi:hypothetical protein
MKTVTFWTSVLVAMIIIFAGIAVINSSPDNPKESREGYVIMEPMEITVPVTVFDFTDEPPMLITPGNGPAED